MSSPKIHEDLVTVVLVGNFNPAIFQPAWLAAKGLIRDSEASEATLEVIHPEVAQFRADWLHVSVTRDRFAASTTDPAHQVTLRDLIIGIFELLEHTPTTALGLNRGLHVDLIDEQAWHALGHLVAPKGPWTGILEKPGMRSLLIEALRTDSAPGRVFFRVEPSQKFKPHGAYLEVNSEYQLGPLSTGEATSYFLNKIRTDWDRVMKDALAGAKKLVEQVLPKGDA